MFRPGKTGGMKRLLIFELNWLGDILFSFPLIKAIRGRYPDIHIACAVVPRYRDLLEYNPWVDEIMDFPDEKGLHSFFKKTSFIRETRKKGFDSCIFLKTSVTKSWISGLCGIKNRIGFSGKKADLTVEIESPDPGLHRVEQLLLIAKHMGIYTADTRYEYPVPRRALESAERILTAAGAGSYGKRLVVVNPGGNWPPKRWPVVNFSELVKKILDNYPDIEVVVTGSGKDISLASEIAERVSRPGCIPLAGQTTLNELAAVFKKSSLVISADSGPLHLASAAGTFTVSLFGPTSSRITGPRGKGGNIIIQSGIECDVPCYKTLCDKDYECMKGITVEKVFEKIKSIV